MTTTHTRVHFMLLGTTIAVFLGLAGAQQPQVQPIPEAVRAARLDQVVPVDPQITVGTLPNGMRYYIRENRLPQGRAELRLAVNAGSVLEDEDQRGIAHFVEHMAFNGTRSFPGNRVGDFMQSLGMRFGAHVNAHTGFDETVYELQIPTDNPSVIDRSLLVLEDFARNVMFDPDEIDKERGGILEEWGSGASASAPASASRISSSRCCSKARATRTGCRSASPRSSATSRAIGSDSSIRIGIAPT
jgi:zinc protease